MCALSRRRRRTVKRWKRTTSTGASEINDDYTLRDDRKRKREGESATARLIVLAREKRWNIGIGRSAERKGVARERKPLACTAVRDSELRASLLSHVAKKPLSARQYDRSAVRFPPFYILWEQMFTKVFDSRFEFMTRCVWESGDNCEIAQDYSRSCFKSLQGVIKSYQFLYQLSRRARRMSRTMRHFVVAFRHDTR